MRLATTKWPEFSEWPSLELTFIRPLLRRGRADEFGPDSAEWPSLVLTYLALYFAEGGGTQCAHAVSSAFALAAIGASEAVPRPRRVKHRLTSDASGL